MPHAQFRREFARAEKSVGVGDGPRFQLRVQPLQIQGEILDAALAKLHIGKPDPLRHDGRIAPRDLQHCIGHVHADHAPRRAHHLRRDETNLSRPAPEIEHRLPGPQMLARIAAAVVALDDLRRDGFQILRIVIHRAAERRFTALRPGGVAFFDGSLDVDWVHGAAFLLVAAAANPPIPFDASRRKIFRVPTNTRTLLMDWAASAVAGRRRASYSGAGLRAHDEGEAGRLLARGLEGLGLTLAQAAALKKTDARKQALAWLVKSRTVVGDEWIVARLEMGHRSNVSRAVSAYREPQAAERRKLLKILHTCTD